MLRLNQISKAALDGYDNDKTTRIDYFIDDVDSYSNFKILRIVKNNNLSIDIYISFTFNDDEFFGVFKNFNTSNIKFNSELFNDTRYPYMDYEYKLKLKNYIKNKLNKWFLPKKGLYKNINDHTYVIDKYGKKLKLKEKSTVEVIGTDYENGDNIFVILKYRDDKYYLKGNDYYFFNYWFEKL
jgi:hypothetical protein